MGEIRFFLVEILSKKAYTHSQEMGSPPWKVSCPPQSALTPRTKGKDMATVAQTQPLGKVFYAHLFDTAGALVKVNGILTFVGDDGSVLDVEPSMVNWLTVLGQMDLADAQHYADLLAGGVPWIACRRAEGVS
jgi:hypothetical protein